MTSISKAIKVAEQGGEYTIKGQLVSRQIFFTRRDGQVGKLLVEVIADQHGELFEVKCWSDKKAYTVYKKFEPNAYVEISASTQIREPNRKYSPAKGEIYSSWFITPIDEFKLKSGVPCFSRITEYHKFGVKPANVAGSFRELVQGPVRKNARGRIIIQGYYLRLIDECCNLFQALIWVNPNLEKGLKCPIKNCGLDDVVLIVAAREQEERYKNNTAGFYTLTTTYPAVVNPRCISKQIYLNLRKGRQSSLSERCIRFDPEK